MTDLVPGETSFPLQEHLGFTIARGGGRAEARIAELGPEHSQPHGATHGAVLFALVDTAMGAAAVSVLPEEVICATSDLQIRYLRPVFGGSLVASAEVVSQGKRQITLRGEIHDGDDKLVATATSAFAVLNPPS